MVDTASGAWELAVRDRLVARDPSALSDLYDQFGSYVFGLAARVIGDRHAAEDVTQEVFLSIWERPEAFEPARGPLAHVPRNARAPSRRSTSCAARKPAAGAPRATRRRSCRSPTSASSRWRSSPPSRCAPRSIGCPREQREAIELAYFGGRTYRQVAEELGIPEGTAKSRMRLGLSRIAQALEAQGVDLAWT